MSIEKYVEEHIFQINNKIADFKNGNNTEYIDTDIKKYLKSKLFIETKNPKIKEKLLKELEHHSYKKNKILDIANKYIYYKSDLTKFYEDIMFQELKQNIEKHEEMLTSKITNIISQSISMDSNHFNYIKSDLKKMLNKSLYISSMNGFPINIVNIESGVMTANAGDSAQFLFLSRAILAGYNASNVDVRSSRYDSVIDHNGVILKVQVKGISSNIVSFKDRDRGGQGIDHTHIRNIGKRITSKDCDIYVAVDKQAGICYIVPMKEIDKLPYDAIKSMNIKAIGQYKENWTIIDEICDSKNKNY